MRGVRCGFILPTCNATGYPDPLFITIPCDRSAQVCVCLAMFLLVLLPGQINPQYAANLTLYREGPPQLTPDLVNEDTGDALGDAYFVLRGLMLPVECKSKSEMAHFDCDNPEQNSTRNTISQYVVTVDTRYGPCAPACHPFPLCLPPKPIETPSSLSSPHPHSDGSCNADATGVYKCSCGKWPVTTPCGAPVGHDDVASRESHYPPAGSEAWMFWRDNLAAKIGGSWYSTHKPGQCADGSMTACTWRVISTPRQIVAACLETRIAQAIIDYNTSCFDACPQPRNASTSCVVECYYSVLLGPHGGTGRIAPSEGIPLHFIQDAWAKAFASKDAAKGGCPDATASGFSGQWPLSWSSRARTA